MSSRPISVSEVLIGDTEEINKTKRDSPPQVPDQHVATTKIVLVKSALESDHRRQEYSALVRYDSPLKDCLTDSENPPLLEPQFDRIRRYIPADKNV